MTLEVLEEAGFCHMSLVLGGPQIHRVGRRVLRSEGLIRWAWVILGIFRAGDGSLKIASVRTASMALGG